MTNEEFEEGIAYFFNETTKQLQSEIVAFTKKYGKDSMLLPLAIENYLSTWYKTATNNVGQIQVSLRIKEEDAILLLKRIHNALYRELFEDSSGLIDE